MASTIEWFGSTSTGSRIQPGVFLKSPIETDHQAVAKQAKLAFLVEPAILEHLGPHHRIVSYLGKGDNGLLLGEASDGSLQTFIDENNSSIELVQRKKWRRQSAEAIAFIHSRGVVHSDLRPENILVHETVPGSLDLLLCDFGGALCEGLGLDGNGVPSDPFYDPTQGFEITTKVDIFSLGSIFYTILTGYWPYRTRAFFREDDTYLDYVDRVTLLFTEGKYPEVDGLWGGNVMMGCWRKEFTTAEQILEALDMQMPTEGTHQDTS